MTDLSSVETLKAAIAKLPGLDDMLRSATDGEFVFRAAVLALPEWAGLETPVAELRCLHTKNPCGTDTWPMGTACHCDHCQRWLRERAAQPTAEDDRARLLDSLEVAQQKIAAGAGLLREVTAQLAAKEAKP